MAIVRRAVLLGGVGGWLDLSATERGGSDYPQRPITLIVPFAPGEIDALARRVADRAAAHLGQPFVYKNQPGAGNRIGTEALALAPRDGYTVGVASTSGLVSGPALAAQRRYDPVADFAPLVLVLEGPYLVVAGPGTGLRRLQDLVRRAKAAPGTLRIASGGVGHGTHLVIERLKLAAGVDLVHVPYKLGAAALADAASGQVELAVTTSASKPLIDSGRLVLLAVASERRLASFDAPTIIESGLNVSVAGWLGFAAPAGVSATVRARLVDAFLHAARDPDVKAAIARTGNEPAEEAGDAFAARIKREFEDLRELNKTLRIVVD
jgi:tripartite-type tricarboxylate transporter receptor subunit TctC